MPLREEQSPLSLAEYAGRNAGAINIVGVQ